MSSGVYVRPTEFRTEALRFLGLVWALVARELKSRYRRSVLGPAWAVLQPLCYMLIFTFIRSVLNISSGGAPYVIFTYSALVPWTFFANAVTRCGLSVSSNAGLLKKIATQREVFPVASVLTTLVDMLIASVILVGMMIWFRVPVTGALLWLPALVVLVWGIALGCGLGVAAVGTYKRDVVFAMPFLMQFWMLATPIMYPLGRVPGHLRPLYRLNPMVGVIEGFRNVLVNGTAPDAGLLLISLGGVVVIWLVAWPVFRYMSQYFADAL